MNKKLIYIIASVILILIVCAISFYIIGLNNTNKDYQVEKIATEEILDECTDEYEYLHSGKLEEANSSEEKISPNAKMTMKKIYNICGHSIDEEVELPQELVNMTKEQLENQYNDWKIEKFSEDEIILSKQYEEQCGEHYILRDNDGMIVIYKINDDGQEMLLDETEISTEYLTQTDLIEIQKGLEVNGLEELNKILEDYE